MMRYFHITVLILLSVLLSPCYSQSVQEERLKKDLETVYNTWRQSMLRQHYEGWQQTTAAYRQMKVRNLAVSEKKPFPASLFAQQIAPASLMPLKYVGTIVKGPTAAATYFGKVDWEIGGTPTENALVLLFTHEKGGWKYDQARFFNLANLPSVKERLRNRDANVLREQDGFQPLGYIPPVPPACPTPRYIAKVFTDCPGRKVDVIINNISYHSFENTRMAEIVSGGLKDGPNSISLNISPLAGAKEKGPMILDIFIMPETQGNIPGRAFRMTLDENQLSLNQTQTFSVTPDIIRGMIPSKENAKK